MISLIKRIYKYFDRLLNTELLSIRYQKIGKPKISRVGYIDINTIAKRYKNTDNVTEISSLLKLGSIRDSIYFLQEACKSYLSEFKKVKNVLDIGCGTGVFSVIFRKSNIFNINFRYYGTEIDKKFVSICEKKYPDEHFIKSYADDLDFKDNAFDFIYCSGTLHYSLDKWKESLDEIARCANRFVAIVRLPLTKYNKNFYVHQTVRGLDGVENHYFIVINRKNFEEYLKKVGFLILERDYSLEEYNVQNLEEKIILCQYLLKKEK